MWKIKDPELKAKVNAFFSDEEINKAFAKNTDCYTYFRLSTNINKSSFTFLIDKDLMGFIPDYNPDDWNPYPTVTPPVDGEKWLTQDEDGNLDIRSFVRTFEEGIDYSWENQDDRLIVAFRSLPAPYQPEETK
jgi:hypothetical protein|nr:MAG TPA: hypothetical protein [Caudoviricetes sp.]